jgi:hypothetical protein
MKRRSRRPDARLIKSRHAYTTYEAAGALGVHRNTIRQWLKQGLPSLNEKRPILILGEHLKAFLAKRRKARRRPCQAGQIFCVKCRSAQIPALGMADYVPISATLGSIVGLCPVCGTIIKRWTSLARLAEVRGQLEVKNTTPQPRLRATAPPASDSHFELRS